MKKSFLLTSLALFALVACGGNTTEAPTETPTETPTEAPATETPATETPTEAPATEAPATEDPTTETPATEEPEPEPEPVNPIADAEAFQTALAKLGSVAPKSMKYTDNYNNKTVEVFNNTKELLVTKTDSANVKSLYIYNGFQGDAFYDIHSSSADRYKVVANPTKGDEVSQADAEKEFADNVDYYGTVYQTVLHSTQLLSRDYSTNSLKWNGGTITSFSSTFDVDNNVVVTYSAYSEGYSMYINSGEVIFDVNGNIKSGSFNRENYSSSNWDSDNHCPNAGATANSSYTYTIINIDTSTLEDPEDVYLLDEDTLNSYFASSITGAQDVTMYVSDTLTANSVQFADDAALVPSTALGYVDSIANNAFITSVGNPDLFTVTTVTPTYGSPYEAYKAVATGTTTVTFGNSFVTKLFTINVTINDISGPIFNLDNDLSLDFDSAEAELGTPTQDATDTSLYHIDLSVLQGTSGAVIVNVPVSISSFAIDKMTITTEAGATNNVTCTGEKYEDYWGGDTYVNLSFTGFETIGNSVINVVSNDTTSPKLSFNVAVTSTPAISLEGTIEVGYDYTSVAEVVSSEAEEEDPSIIHTHVRAMKGNSFELEATVNNSTSSVDLDALSITTSGTQDSEVTIGEPSYYSGYGSSSLTLPITIGDTLGYSHFILSSTADDSKTIYLDIEVIDTPAAELSLTSPVSANTKLSVKEGEAILRDPTVDTENSLTYHANLEVIKGEDAVTVQIPNNSAIDFDINSVTATVDATDNSLGVTASVEKYSNSYYGNSVYLNLAITASEGTSTVTVASTSSTSLKFVFHLTAVDVDGPEITNAYFGNSSATGFLATDFALDEATGNYVNDIYLLANSSTRDLLVKVNNAVPSDVTKFHVTSNITDDNHIATVAKNDTSYVSSYGTIYVSWTAGTTLGDETYTITSENTNARTYVVNIHVVETLPTL
ncbi:MAG: hypothetical protein PUI56_02400 [bacterium]|nr:hypothetical protein [bacterium]MDY5257161.1 hypothetical protein [Candidatus Enterosoma sp.]